MVEIEISPDRISSLIASYHILCAPSSRAMEYNPRLFNDLNVSQEEKKIYLDYFASKGVPSEDLDKIRLKLLPPRLDTLKDFFDFAGNKLPSNIANNLEKFESRFNPYFSGVMQSVEPFILVRKKQSEDLIYSIYGIAQKFSGVAIPQPDNLDIRIVEGISPSSQGSQLVDGKQYIIHQVRNLMSEDFHMNTLVHETIGHHTVNPLRKKFASSFKDYCYSYEEGFVKLFTTKVMEGILNRPFPKVVPVGREELSYNSFSKNWDLLDGTNFESWYLKCLNEIGN